MQTTGESIQEIARRGDELYHQIRLSEKAWADFVQMTSGDVKARQLAREEGREFLRHLGEGLAGQSR